MLDKHEAVVPPKMKYVFFSSFLEFVRDETMAWLSFELDFVKGLNSLFSDSFGTKPWFHLLHSFKF